MRWGLIPSWAKDPQVGARMINARSETVADKPSFRSAYKRRRCLVVADGYYEWKSGPDGKQPFWIRRKDDQPFGMAGLWESWRGTPDHLLDPPWQTCTIITAPANDFARTIHDRMPVILGTIEAKIWLDPDTPADQELASLLLPYSGDDLKADRVSRRVNNPKWDDPACVEILSVAQ
jgi:putative SOS response-associated peptidase YedK